MTKVQQIVIGIVAVGWVILFFGEMGILVGSHIVYSADSAPENVCHYFIGTGVIEERNDHYACPRLLQ